MYAVYSPLFLKQEDAYFGSSRGCYIQGRKVFIADFSFHICTETAASVRVLDRDGNFENLSESKGLRINTHTYSVLCFFMRTVTIPVHRTHMVLHT